MADDHSIMREGEGESKGPEQEQDPIRECLNEIAQKRRECRSAVPSLKAALLAEIAGLWGEIVCEADTPENQRKLAQAEKAAAQAKEAAAQAEKAAAQAEKAAAQAVLDDPDATDGAKTRAEAQLVLLLELQRELAGVQHELARQGAAEAEARNAHGAGLDGARLQFDGMSLGAATTPHFRPMPPTIADLAGLEEVLGQTVEVHNRPPGTPLDAWPLVCREEAKAEVLRRLGLLHTHSPGNDSREVLLTHAVSGGGKTRFLLSMCAEASTVQLGGPTLGVYVTFNSTTPVTAADKRDTQTALALRVLARYFDLPLEPLRDEVHVDLKTALAIVGAAYNRFHGSEGAPPPVVLLCVDEVMHLGRDKALEVVKHCSFVQKFSESRPPPVVARALISSLDAVLEVFMEQTDSGDTGLVWLPLPPLLDTDVIPHQLVAANGSRALDESQQLVLRACAGHARCIEWLSSAITCADAPWNFVVGRVQSALQRLPASSRLPTDTLATLVAHAVGGVVLPWFSPRGCVSLQLVESYVLNSRCSSSGTDAEVPVIAPLFLAAWARAGLANASDLDRHVLQLFYRIFATGTSGTGWSGLEELVLVWRSLRLWALEHTHAPGSSVSLTDLYLGAVRRADVAPAQFCGGLSEPVVESVTNNQLLQLGVVYKLPDNALGADLVCASRAIIAGEPCLLLEVIQVKQRVGYLSPADCADACCSMVDMSTRLLRDGMVNRYQTGSTNNEVVASGVTLPPSATDLPTRTVCIIIGTFALARGFTAPVVAGVHDVAIVPGEAFMRALGPTMSCMPYSLARAREHSY